MPQITRLAILTICLGVFWLAPVVQAQEGEPSPVAAPVAAEQDDTILSLILDGGVTGIGFMVVLGVFSLAAVTIAVERAVNTRRDRILPSEFAERLRTLSEDSQTEPQQLRPLIGQYPSPAATILRAGLLRAGRSLAEVEKSMEDAAAREMESIRSGIRPLSVIGSIAPLVGLLGTVVGMIIAFRVASQSGLGKGEMLAQGIYMALFTTAAGLMIAIPCLLFAARLNSKVDRIFREIDELLMEALPCFERVERVAAVPERRAAASVTISEDEEEFAAAGDKERVVWIK